MTRIHPDKLIEIKAANDLKLSIEERTKTMYAIYIKHTDPDTGRSDDKLVCTVIYALAEVVYDQLHKLTIEQNDPNIEIYIVPRLPTKPDYTYI